MNPPAPACLYGRVRSFALFAADDPCAAPAHEAFLAVEGRGGFRHALRGRQAGVENAAAGG